MSFSLVDQVVGALGELTSATRLYALSFGDDGPNLLVEAFSADEGLQAIGARDIIALSTDAHIELAPLLGKPATLETSLADGTRARFSGTGLTSCFGGSDYGYVDLSAYATDAQIARLNDAITHLFRAMKIDRAELLARGGIYAKLYRNQFQGEVAG